MALPLELELAGGELHAHLGREPRHRLGVQVQCRRNPGLRDGGGLRGLAARLPGALGGETAEAAQQRLVRAKLRPLARRRFRNRRRIPVLGAQLHGDAELFEVDRLLTVGIEVVEQGVHVFLPRNLVVAMPVKPQQLEARPKVLLRQPPPPRAVETPEGLGGLQALASERPANAREQGLRGQVRHLVLLREDALDRQLLPLHLRPPPAGADVEPPGQAVLDLGVFEGTPEDTQVPRLEVRCTVEEAEQLLCDLQLEALLQLFRDGTVLVDQRIVQAALSVRDASQCEAARRRPSALLHQMHRCSQVLRFLERQLHVVATILHLKECLRSQVFLQLSQAQLATGSAGRHHVALQLHIQGSQQHPGLGGVDARGGVLHVSLEDFCELRLAGLHARPLQL
mmetsp:Transcript_160243/g.514124  ORF Transcript_160243/g.514124 Transcript_160243/m.514124 type:complete len:397 (-) Transcript_160243:7200-8390(-)